MRRLPISLALAALWACAPQPERDACPADATCCVLDYDCSDGIFCNGVERCVEGRCAPPWGPACDDGLECTIDSCDEQRNACLHSPDDAVCDDGDLCTGEERCVPADRRADGRGCTSGPPHECEDDGDPCTQEVCEENECVRTLPDADGDGYGDFRCSMCEGGDPSTCVHGDDCDDGDRSVNPGATEVCGDGVDNDCDDLADYSDAPCHVSNDSCATPLRLSDGVTVFGSTRGTGPDVESACDDGSARDAAFAVELADVSDLEIEVVSFASSVTVSLGTACGDPDSELGCGRGREASVMRTGLGPGSYSVVVSAAVELDFAVTAWVHAPAVRPASDLCETAIAIEEPGGSFEGTTAEAAPDYASACGSPDDPDVAYVVDLEEPRGLTVELAAGTGGSTLAVQQRCGVYGDEVFCATGEAAVGRVFRSLAPGAYYLVVKTAAAGSFSLDVAFAPPAPIEILPYTPPSGAAVHPAPTDTDDGQYDVDIRPLSFPFNGEAYDCLAVSTNGYVRFGSGSCPLASGYSDASTDVDRVYEAGIPQVSWLADDGEAGSDVAYEVLDGLVVVTYLGHRRHGGEPLLTNDVQLVFDCDTGDIQISYVDCSFDLAPEGSHFSIGVSEPAHAGSMHAHDLTVHPRGATVHIGPGAIGQSPAYEVSSAYAPLDGSAVYFQRSGDGWALLVDALP